MTVLSLLAAAGFLAATDPADEPVRVVSAKSAGSTQTAETRKDAECDDAEGAPDASVAQLSMRTQATSTKRKPKPTRLPHAPPRLREAQLEFTPPQRPRLLDEDEQVPCPEPLPIAWVLEQAQLTRPAPLVLPTPAEQPSVTTELGLGGSATIWGVRVWADQAARIDAKGTADDIGPRVRLSGRRSVGVDAVAIDRVHLGLELSRRDGTGLNPLPDETRATASLRFGF